METLDYNLLRRVQEGLRVKRAFVPMPGGQAEPVAGASQMTAGMGAPMGAPMGGGDPAAGGAPMDPAAMMGAMPPGVDPAMMGIDPMTGMPIGAPPPGMEGEEAPAEPPPPPEPPFTLDDVRSVIKDEIAQALKGFSPSSAQSGGSGGGGESASKSTGGGDSDGDLSAEVRELTMTLRQALGA